MTITMIVQLLIVLLALWVGSRFGSLALGAISGIGLAILVFGFGLKPGTPPTDVMDLDLNPELLRLTLFTSSLRP